MIKSQMFTNLAPVRLQSSPAAAVQATPAQVTKQFASFLEDAINGVAQQEHAVAETTNRFIIGQADVSELMIVSEQAKLNLQLTAQIRNKMIESYQEIMRMQI